MKRVLTASLVLAFVVPGTCAAQPLSAQANHLRREVVAKLGPRAPGRNIVRWGVLHRGHVRSASTAEIRGYINVMRRMIAPPPAPRRYVVHSAPTTSIAPTPTTSTPSSSGYTGGGYAIPSSIVMCESGGNPHAVNSSSGAGGLYQILPSTWQAYGGTGSPQDASVAEQSAIASKIWNGGAGRSQWSC